MSMLHPENRPLERTRGGGLMTAAAAIGGLALVLSGCRSAPPPPRVPVPSSSMRTQTGTNPKPLPPQDVDIRPFHDEPIVRQPLPGQAEFVRTYQDVGSPRIVIFVNRTLQGRVIPLNPRVPQVTVEQTRRATTGVTVEHSTGNRYTGQRSIDRFKTTGPGEYQQSAKVYLRPGEYDEVAAKSLDYQAMENLLTDWMRADGHVEMVSPTMARSRLNEQQIQDLQSGRPRELSEIARQLNADVLIQVQAHPTRQTPQGLEVRVVAEAISLQGGQSIGQAMVDVPPPLEKTQLNRYTRFLAEKLMDDMTHTWLNAPPPATRPTTGQ